MQVVNSSHGNTLKILGKPKKSEHGYRFMTYVLEKSVEDGHLLFHTLTREMLLLTNEEYEDLLSLSELYEKWFLVPKALDDMKYADLVRLIRKTVKKKSNSITQYTVFTTTDCNARCFYCYENGCKKIKMSEETAHQAANYMIQHSNGEKISIEWFGGEPLYNKSVINIICKDLQDNGVEYSSCMISNGYLFDTEMIQESIDLWKLKNVQITLDGTEEVYNRSKAFIYKDAGSPYQIVLGNIEALLSKNIAVVIRMNIDNHNADNLSQLIEELHQRFPNQKKLSAYVHVLFEFAGSKEKIRDENNRKTLYHKKQFLCDKLENYGFLSKNGIKRYLPVNMCMADSGTAYTILPDGKLGLCEHCTDDFFVGDILTEKIDQDIVRLFQEAWEKEPACDSCACYPECIRLKKCAEQTRCFTEMMEDKKGKILSSMLYTYKMWKNKQDEEEISSISC